MAFDIGRLAQLGPKAAWQCAFLLPHSWDDIQRPITHFRHIPIGKKIVVRGRLHSPPTLTYNARNIPQLKGTITDGINRLSFSAFGDSRKLTEELKRHSEDVILSGEVARFHGMTMLTGIDLIAPKWIGRLRPNYPGKQKVITPDTVRNRMMGLLADATVQAAEWIPRMLGMNESELLSLVECRSDWALLDVLKRSHLPLTVNDGWYAHKIIDRIAALGVVRKAFTSLEQQSAPQKFAHIEWSELIRAFPYSLSVEQITAIKQIAAKIASPGLLRHCLSGDVGTGKTAVYTTIAVAVVAAGGRSVVMLPNEPLAQQIAAEIKRLWPMIRLTYVSGSTPPTTDLTESRLIVGTQALLFRPLGEIDLLVVDEQQKFSRQQREELMSAQTHLLEVSATCIPRSQALIRFGAVSMSRLHKGHVAKTLYTRIWRSHERSPAMDAIRATLEDGGKVIVVYPKKSNEDDDAGLLPSAEEAYRQWDRLFPGLVRLAHGGLDDAINQKAIDEMKSGAASVLVSTSLVEVGLNIPNLRRIVVVHAERFGLSTLHQIRGRLAREGGEGHCDLILPFPVKPEVEERLSILCETNDGFAVAEADMRIRGFGDLSSDSSKQSGADATFLYGRALQPETLEYVLGRIEEVTKGR